MLKLNHFVFALPSKNPPKGEQLYLSPAGIIFYSIIHKEKKMNSSFWTHYDLFICSDENIEAGDDFLIPNGELQHFGRSKRYREADSNCFKVVRSTVGKQFGKYFLSAVILSHFGSKSLPFIEIPESAISLELKNNTAMRLINLEEKCTV
jgi:hypothetical protein